MNQTIGTNVSDLLAIEGGAPVRTSPLPTWPSPGAEEISAVTAVLTSGRLNYWTGEQGHLLEQEFSAYLGRDRAIAVANGTVALELALRAFGIGAGDKVVVPARTFIATASAVVAVGATPIVCDVDPVSGTMTAESASAVLDASVRAVIPVHLGGWPVDLDPILELAEHHDLVVIEDCAQAHGGTYRGRPIGAGPSHAAAFSFCQDKIIPVGDGGLVVLDDEAAYTRAWEYKDHGKSLAKLKDPAFMDEPASFRWLHDEFGTNWRLDEMSSAVARVGLTKLPSWHHTRTAHARRIAEGLTGVRGIRVLLPGDGAEHAFYRLYATIVPEELTSGWNRDRILEAVLAEGVRIQYGSCAEVYREGAFIKHGLGPAQRLPNAARLDETSLAFFVHPTLGNQDIDDTVTAVRKVLGVATS
ncbi:MAG: aminotransferase [Actinobacteria bacterium HGW-Actinobacteria-6]|nr:MAG: aminotransferase [Actinobacteria bacterium HGW-Actinobacteria-6]